MNTDKYLERINYSGKTNANLDNLRKIHQNHLYFIPFENLDIHNNKKIILNLESVERKVISNSRGGYCYELNGLFYHLLKELGYNVKMISARVNSGDGKYGEEFDHLAIVVELDELWLADVGFGDSFIEPVSVNMNKSQKNLNGWFKISKSDSEIYSEYLKISKSYDNTEYSDEYIFTLKERKWYEFNEMNIYHQTSPDSPFTRKKLCTIAKENGRITLTDQKLTVTEGSDRIITEINGKEDFYGKLYEYFRIRI
ncbi:MAG: arylamine N-acetyltransferase [Ignavibacteria bacterium]|nr:arylamine N-acetyltransferase [Ignavibacteria bacterium]